MIQGKEYQITFSLIWSRSKEIRSPVVWNDPEQGWSDHHYLGQALSIWSPLDSITESLFNPLSIVLLNPQIQLWKYWTRNLIENFSGFVLLGPLKWGVSRRMWVRCTWANALTAYWTKGQILPRSERPSQRLAKHWPRAKKDQTKVLEKLSQCQLIIKGIFRRRSKLLKFVIVIIEKLFNHHFSSFFWTIHSHIKDFRGGSTNFTDF